MKTTLLIPVINEIEGMKVILPRIQDRWVDQKIVLDGGSTDGSQDYAREMGYEVYVQKAPGLRKGYMEVLPMIKGDIIVTFSPDGNSVPEAIPDLIGKMRQGYDMVIASRYKNGAKSDDDDWLTAFGNRFFTKMVNLFFRHNLTDVMVIFRAFRKNLIMETGLDQERWYRKPEQIFRCNISWEPLLTARCTRQKRRIAEIFAPEPRRIGGVRKLLPFRWGAAYLYQILTERFCFYP